MAYIAKTMFEVKVSNSPRNQTQHVPGKFGTNTGASFVPADCSAGMLCVRNGLIPSEGYESKGILNGNTWYFNAATNGAVAERPTGDHTGIFAFDNYDVSKAVSTDGQNQWNIGYRTLGLGLPAGNRGDFCEIIIGEQYNFGAGNFSTLPTGTQTVVTISNGLLVAADAAPTDGSVYFKLLRTAPVNEGTTYWGLGYILEACRATVA